MSITTIFLYIIYSIILFILLEVINNKYKINKIDYIVLSLIYLIIISGISSTRTTNIFLVIIIEFLLRIFYVNNIEEHSFIKIHKDILITYLITIISAYFLNMYYINKVDNIFPEPNELKIIIWLCIIIFIYKELKNNINKNINIDKFINKENIVKYKEEYIITEYAKYKNEYYNLINSKHKELIPIIYSIIIYENYHRSKAKRKIDNLLFKINPKERKLGIAQVISNKLITDEESIDILTNKLELIYNKISKKKNIDNISIEIIKNYYPNNYDNIINIYNKIIEFNKK